MPQSAWSKAGRFNNRQKDPRLSDLLPIKKFKSGTFYRERFIGPAFSFAEHWIEIFKKDGAKTKIPKICLSFDNESGEFKGSCPYCEDLGDKPRVTTLQCSIDRKAQKNEPRRKPKPLPSELKAVKLQDGLRYCLKEKDSETWTPVSVLRLTSSPAQNINNMAAINEGKDEKGRPVMCGPEDPRYGFDVTIKYDESQSPANAYYVQKEKRTKLTPEEMKYPIFDLQVIKVESKQEAKKQAADLLPKLVNKGEDSGKESKSKDKDRSSRDKGSKSKDYLSDLSDNSDSDASGTFKPKSKSKSKSSSSRNKSSRDKSDKDRSSRDKERHRSSSSSKRHSSSSSKKAASGSSSSKSSKSKSKSKTHKRRGDGLDL